MSNKHMVLVDAGALQMVRNALKRDAESGNQARAEMLDELDKATTQQDRAAFDPVAEASRIVSASARKSANDDNWRKLFWQVAKVLNCLPSSFVDGNEHVLRKAQELQARAATK